MRYFCGPRPLVWPIEGGVFGTTPVVVSFKRPPAEVVAGAHDGEIKAWLALLPRDRPTYIAYEHEMDAKIAKGEYTAEAVRAAYIHVAKLVAAQGNPQLKDTLILTGYQYRPRLAAVWPGPEYVDVLGVDTYRWSNESVSQLFAENLAIAREYRKPLGLAEFGLWQGSTTQKAGWLGRELKYLDGKVAWICYSTRTAAMSRATTTGRSRTSRPLPGPGGSASPDPICMDVLVLDGHAIQGSMP